MKRKFKMWHQGHEQYIESAKLFMISSVEESIKKIGMGEIEVRMPEDADAFPSVKKYFEELGYCVKI
jgi:hypothetical protein